jgi:hypothetical protein
MKKCSVCNEEIHPKRLEILPGTKTCVKHSTVEKKVAVTVQMGEGDHTWTEVFAVEREDYDRLEEMEKNIRKINSVSPKINTNGFEEEDEEEEENEDIKNNLDLDPFTDIIEF